MKKLILFILPIITALMISACASSLTPQASSNDTNTVMTVDALTLSAMPSASPTAASTITSTPEPVAAFTSTPEPTTLRVVYSRAGGIWIWSEGGQPEKLSSSGIDIQPRISSDGKIVVFARNNELYAVNADGSDLRKIVSKEYLNPYRLEGYKWIWADYYDWMLDTHTLYFTTKSQLGDDGFPIYQFDLHRINVDTGEVSIVLPAGQGGIPYFSPNGQTLAVAQSESISLANVDGTNWRTALTFRHVSTYSEWSFIPTIVPLPNGNGFRTIIPVFHIDPMDNSDEPSKLLDIPLVGEPVLLYSFPLRGYSHRILSPDGNSIVFSIKDAKGTYSLCVYHHNVAQETCTTKADREVFANNWASDESKYTFQTINKILVESNYVFETTYYVASEVEPNNPPVEIDSYVWLTWVSPDQYVYIDQDWNLRLATFNGSSIQIHNGVKNQASKDGILPFDFSTN